MNCVNARVAVVKRDTIFPMPTVCTYQTLVAFHGDAKWTTTLSDATNAVCRRKCMQLQKGVTERGTAVPENGKKVLADVG